MTRSTLARVAVLGLLLPAAGCATPHVSWDKPGVTQAERQRDSNECLRTAIDSDDQGRVFSLYHVDRDTYAKCLETRGYVVRSQ